MRTLIVFAMFCPFLQGCVGVAVLKPHTEVIDDPVIASIPNDADPAHKRKSSEAANAVVYASEWVQTHWGNPYRVNHVSGSSDEIWTYRFRPIWEGIVPCVIVPIPLVLPVGRQKICFRLHDGCVVSASSTVPWMVGGVAGFMLSPEGGGNFGASSMNEEAPN